MSKPLVKSLLIIILIAFVALFFGDEIRTALMNGASASVMQLSGTVVDSESKQPIAATITYETVPHGNKYGIEHSDERSGRFKITLIEGETYEVSVKSPSYKSEIQQIVVDELKKNDESGWELTFELQSVSPGKLFRIENLNFDQGSAILSGEAQQALEEIVLMMYENDVMEIQLEGHTDFRGNSTANMKLAKERVEEVEEYLVSRGVDKGRIRTKALGGEQPLSRENTEEARLLNRRVEVRILAS
ncbi:MAG: OmpA family protein [Cytophagales bacterium]|nr:OmpA family protein [Cytophagales bacterium]